MKNKIIAEIRSGIAFRYSGIKIDITNNIEKTIEIPPNLGTAEACIFLGPGLSTNFLMTKNLIRFGNRKDVSTKERKRMNTYFILAPVQINFYKVNHAL